MIGRRFSHTSQRCVFSKSTGRMRRLDVRGLCSGLCRFVLPMLYLMFAVGCDRLDMYDQPRYEPLEASQFFADGLSARPSVEGTVARGELRDDVAFFTGKSGKTLIAQIPEAAYRTIYERNP